MISAIEQLLLVRSLPVFRTLSLERVAAISQRLPAVTLPDGATRSTTEHDSMALVVIAGRFHMHESDQDRAFGTGEVAGLMEMLADEPREIDFVSEGESEALVLTRDDLEDLCEEDFAVVEGLLGWLAAEIPIRPAQPVSAASGRPSKPVAMLPPIARRIAALAATRAFPPDQLDAMAELAQQADLVGYPTGHVLWNRGEDSDRLFVLVEGAVRLRPGSDDGFPVDAGTLLGQFDAFAGVPRRTLATVTTDVEALSIGIDSFLDVLEDHPQLATGFLTIQARHVLNLRTTGVG